MADIQDVQEVFSKIGEGAREMAEKAAEGLKGFTTTVAEKTSKMQANTKLNATKNSKEKELQETYNKLGRLAYQKGGLTGEMADLSDKIHTLYQELQEIELNLNKN